MGKIKAAILDGLFDNAYCTECGRAFAMDSETVTGSGAYCKGGTYHRDYGEPDAWIEGGDCPDCAPAGASETVYDGCYLYHADELKAMEIAERALRTTWKGA